MFPVSPLMGLLVECTNAADAENLSRQAVAMFAHTMTAVRTAVVQAVNTKPVMQKQMP